MLTIADYAKSIKTNVNKGGYDGIEVSSTEVILADGENFKVEYVQILDEGTFISDADGTRVIPFEDISRITDAENIYEEVMNNLV